MAGAKGEQHDAVSSDKLCLLRRVGISMPNWFWQLKYFLRHCAQLGTTVFAGPLPEGVSVLGGQKGIGSHPSEIYGAPRKPTLPI